MTNDKRERLFNTIIKSDILCDTCGESTASYCAEALADHIIADGWMRPPCKVGDTVYFLHRLENRITEHIVDNFYVGKKGMSIRVSGVMHPVKPYEFGRIFFNSKEEAENALGGVQG